MLHLIYPIYNLPQYINSYKRSNIPTKMMQEQQKITTPATNSPLTQQQIANLKYKIKQTYEGRSTAQVKQAQDELMRLLSSNKKIVENLFAFLKTPFEMELSFRRACANLIKKYYYMLAQDKDNKNSYIQLVYDVLLAVGYGEYGIKEIVAVGLQYIFNKDEYEQYKPKWAQHIKSQLFGLVENPEAWTLQTLQVIHGLVLFSISLLNSYVEPEQQVNFVNELLRPLCKAGSLCAQFTRQNINQSINTKILFACPQKIFQFLELATQRLLEQQQIIPEQVSAFKTSEHFSNLILEYLYIFSEGQSIITKYNDLNEIKASIVQILYTMTAFDCNLDISIVTVLFSTFIGQSSRSPADDNDDFNDRIVCKTIGILEKMLEKKMHYEFFINNKIQIVFALFMYCKTSPQQLSDMYEEPEKFVMLAQQFSQSFASSPIVKVRASNLLKTFVNRIDEGLSNITQLCVIFITGSILPSQSDSQILKMAKQAYSTFQFMNMSAQQKLDISFMILTVLSQNLEKRPDTRAIITSILMTNFNSVFQITNELVLIRLIRLIGYYPNAIYFSFVTKCMMMSKANLLQGLNSYDRISRNKMYLEIFPLMHMVFLGIVDYLQVGQPVFQRLVHENYENILKKSQQLYLQILTKIYENFCEVIKNLAVNKSKQRAIICLNYIQKMMKMQKTQKYLQILEAAYIKMQEVGINVEILEDNFIGVQCMLINKSMIVSPRIEQFVLAFSRPQKIGNYSNNQYFQLLNKYILKAENSQILTQIHTNLTSYLGQSQNIKFNFAILPQLVHCIGHIAMNNYQKMEINQNYLLFIVRLAGKKQQVRGYLTMYQSWYTFLVLHYFYLFAPKMREFMLNHKVYYPFMMTLFNTKWNTKIQRKLAVIAAQELLYYQTDPKLQSEIVKYCVAKLKEQKEKYEIKPNKKNIKQKRRQKIEKGEKDMRIDEEDMEGQYCDRESQEECIENSQKDKDEVALFKKFKHPCDKICEFSMFRQRIHGLSHQLKQIDEKNIPGISQILQRQWHQNSLRRIFRVSK